MPRTEQKLSRLFHEIHPDREPTLKYTVERENATEGRPRTVQEIIFIVVCFLI